MELSGEIQSILQKYKVQSVDKCEKISGNNKESDINCDMEDVIDVDQIDMPNDQTWLLELETDPTINDLNKWLYEDTKTSTNHLTIIREKSKVQATTPTKKNFDSRTFTRPKKKFNRPSIEKYNEDYFDAEKPHSKSLSDEIDNYISSCKEDDGSCGTERPLHFDLSQPTSGSFFDRILSSAPELDSFQNMSPPSLVNSMCSSTFTNLMDSSFIKNDPILREIRDADYSQVIYQDGEPPLLQSFTESCSSINSEVAENFVRKTLTTLNGTFNISTSSDTEFNKTPPTEVDSDTYTDNPSGESFTPPDNNQENIDLNINLNLTQPTLIQNGTFRKSASPKLNSTFNKESKLNGTFNKSIKVEEISEKEREQLNNLEKSANKVMNGYYPDGKENCKRDLNATYYKENNLNGTFKKSDRNNFNHTFDKRLSSVKNNLDATFDVKSEEIDSNMDQRRLSAEIDDFLNEKLNSAHDRNKDISDASHLRTDSSDSLDRMSSLSNSSRESRMMAEVDAIVEQQERSLQVMSTPKPAKSLTKLFESTCLSPIPNLNIKEHLSDSEISSEEYTTVRSRVSLMSEKQSTLERNVKSLNNLQRPSDIKKPRGINTMTSNLRIPTTKSKSNDEKLTGSYSNLRSIGSNLKASYTNLRPLHTNLPNIPPKSSNETTVKREAFESTKKEVFKVPQLPKENPSSANSTFTRPQSRISCLPRPVSSTTGIPRPFSKIPAPKSARSSSSGTSRTSMMRPSSKTNINDGFY